MTVRCNIVVVAEAPRLAHHPYRSSRKGLELLVGEEDCVLFADLAPRLQWMNEAFQQLISSSRVQWMNEVFQQSISPSRVQWMSEVFQHSISSLLGPPVNE